MLNLVLVLGLQLLTQSVLNKMQLVLNTSNSLLLNLEGCLKEFGDILETYIAPKTNPKDPSYLKFNLKDRVLITTYEEYRDLIVMLEKYNIISDINDMVNKCRKYEDYNINQISLTMFEFDALSNWRKFRKE
jgi:hypothetical protein